MREYEGLRKWLDCNTDPDWKWRLGLGWDGRKKTYTRITLYKLSKHGFGEIKFGLKQGDPLPSLPLPSPPTWTEREL